MKIEYSKQANKFLDSQNDKTYERITSAVRKLPNGNVRKMQGYSVPTYRLTVGSFRVLFNLGIETISVIKIDNRGQVYKN